MIETSNEHFPGFKKGSKLYCQIIDCLIEVKLIVSSMYISMPVELEMDPRCSMYGIFTYI